MKLYIWELNLKQEKGSIIPVPVPRTGISPKMKQKDLTPNQDTIPIIDMIPAPEQEFIDSNLLEEDQNPQIMINREHSLEHRTIPPFGALAADVIIVTRTRRHYKK